MARTGPVRKGSFTPRQAEIVDLVGNGMADKEIARQLGVSVATIRTQLQRLYRGLGAHNRAQAVAERLSRGAPGHQR